MMLLELCDNGDILSILRIVRIVLQIIRVAVPIILILSLLIGYTRAVGSKEDDALHRANKSTVAKVIAAVLVFLIPTFIDLLADIGNFDSNQYIACFSQATKENINQAYKKEAEKKIDLALSTLTKGDYLSAVSIVRKIKDESIKAELTKELEEIEYYIKLREQIYELAENYDREKYLALTNKINAIKNADVKERLLEELKTVMSNIGSSYLYDLNPSDPKYKGLKPIKNPITLTQILAQNGSSVEKFNYQIETAVDSVGVGTRQAPVIAGLTLIDTLAEYGYYIIYKWGGKFYNFGVNGRWGSITSPISCNTYPGGEDVCRATQIYSGFDCSGFVNWALIQGNRNKSNPTEYTRIKYNSDIHLRGQSSAVCNIGDVLVSGGHIVLVAGLDEENKRYIILESGGGHGGVGMSYKNYNDAGYYCRKLKYSN